MQPPETPTLSLPQALLGVAASIFAASAVIATLLGLVAASPADAAQLRVVSERASPERAFYVGARPIRYRFELGGKGKQTVRVQAVRKGNYEVARSWRLEGVRSGQTASVRWNGTSKGGGQLPNGSYFFRVREARGGSVAARKRRSGDRSVALSHHVFPVRGRHTYGDGFGAGRNHRGQDVFARCGTRMVAARAGRVQFKASQRGGAGHYVVIDGIGTSTDYVYMHLQRPTRLRRGQRVRTGQLIGKVGASGNASGCHLHFERWSRPGWQSGGRAMRSVTNALRRWDRWT